MHPLPADDLPDHAVARSVPPGAWAAHAATGILAPLVPRYLVTSALPYANGPVHLGHVAGAYLPADIYVRWLRLAGEEALFICGTDEHGTPITISADQEHVTPAEIVARYHADQDLAFQSLDIAFDIYSGTSTCPHHAALAQEFFARLHARGDIAPQDTQQYFCVTDRRFLPDRYVEGRCPKCGNPEARGDQCEKCGEPLRELEAPRCKLCGSTPELRATRHWFFHLERYAERLTAWLDSREGWREQVVRFSRNFIPELKPRSITRDLAWGVDVPLPDAAGKKLYVWFDAPIGYVSFTRELGERRGDPTLWERWWKSPDTRVVHFIGKDNIVFHAVIWPAMLMGMGDHALPWDVPANEWLNLPEGKFSKSAHRGRSVHEAVAEWSADAIRYYLTAIAPETRDSVFTPEDLVTRNDSELADIIGNFAQRGLAFVARHGGGRVPPCGAPRRGGVRPRLQQVRGRPRALEHAGHRPGGHRRHRGHHARRLRRPHGAAPPVPARRRAPLAHAARAAGRPGARRLAPRGRGARPGAGHPAAAARDPVPEVRRCQAPR